MNRIVIAGEGKMDKLNRGWSGQTLEGPGRARSPEAPFA